jgi:methylated-DNA-protein-cysteine methyltransferase related protein
MTLKEKVLNCVKDIPDGKVAYFGFIADVVGSDARTVGWILTGLTEDEMRQVSWYRVVAKDGYVSSLKLGAKGLVQKQLLAKEGYTLIEDHVDIQKHMWTGSLQEGELLF